MSLPGITIQQSLDVRFVQALYQEKEYDLFMQNELGGRNHTLLE